MNKINVAIYSRKSRFVEGSDSIENQIEMCKEYINKNFKNVSDLFIYEDEGFSGKNINRPQFTQLLKDAKNKMFNVLVCYRLDRISRNVADFSNIITELQKLNIDFISIKEQFDTSSPMGRAMLYISSVFAQLERETIAERVRDNLIELSKEGRWLGGQCPLGYVKKGMKKDSYFEVSDNYTLVQEMFNKYLELKSLSAVSKWVVDKRLKTKQNKEFSAASIRVILTNPVYCIADESFYNYAKENKMIICNSKEEFVKNKEFGVMCFNKTNGKKNNTAREKNEWIVAIGKHKGIVNADKWVDVQNIIMENVKKIPRSGTSNFALLSGIIKCAKCDGIMTVGSSLNKYNKRFFYYRCTTKSLSAKLCNNKNLSVKKSDDMVLEFIKTYRYNKPLLRQLYEENKSEFKESNIFEEMKKINDLINKNTLDIEKLTEKLIDAENSVASKYILQKIEKLDGEVVKLNKELTELKGKEFLLKNKKQNFELLEENIDYLIDNLEDLTMQEKQKLVNNIIRVALWDGEDLKIKLLK